MAQENDNKELTGRLIQFRDFSQDPSHQVLLDIRGYWNAQLKGGAVPYRSDIKAAGLGRAVDFAFIAERIAPGMARYRLAGQHLHKVMGMEVRGMPLAAVLRSSARKEFSDILESVFKTPQIAELWLAAPVAYARPKITARMLLLPLKSDLGDVTRVFGGLITSGDFGQTPRCFDVERYELSPVITGGRTIRPNTEATRNDPPTHRPAFDRRSKISAIATTTPEQRRMNFRVVSERGSEAGPDY